MAITFSSEAQFHKKLDFRKSLPSFVKIKIYPLFLVMTSLPPSETYLSVPEF